MKRKLKTQCKLGIVFTLMAFLLWNCKQNPNGTGMELLPGSDIKTVGLAVDSTQIKVYTKHDVLIRTDEPTYNIFGTFNDPIFGKTSASMAFHVRLPYYPAFPATAQPDSVILHLLYKNVYGDTITPQTLKVYKLQSDIVADTTGAHGTANFPYYQDVDLKSLASSTPIGELTFTPKFRLDSLGTDTIIQDLAIKLDNSLAQRLVTADSTDMVNNDVFLKKLFKGLYVETQSQDITSGGTLLSIYTLAGGTDMALYYTYNYSADSLAHDSLIYRINSSSARISSYTHDYSTTAFGSKLESETSQDSLIYLQTMGGLRAKVEVPSLSDWADSSQNSAATYVINKAELIFHVDTVASEYNQYPLPQNLELRLINPSDPEGVGTYPEDYTVSASLYGGYYNSTDATYKFIITHRLQNIIDGATNDGFYLTTTNQADEARRVVLKGATSHVGIRLEVTYTKLN